MNTERVARLPLVVMLTIVIMATFLFVGGYLGVLPKAAAAPEKKPYGAGKTIYYEAGANSFTMTVDPAWPSFMVHQVELHLTATANTALLCSRDSGLGAAFDTVFTPISTIGVLDATWRPDPPVICGPDDTFVVEFPNTNALNWGCQVYIEGIFK